MKDIIIKNENKKNYKKILVIPLEKNENDILDESKEIICPNCKEHCRIKIQDYLIKLYNCKNQHS